MQTKTRKPTVNKLIKRFPDMPVQENCLEDIACPKCGNRNYFKVEVMTIVGLHDDGTDGYGDTDWDRNSYMACDGGNCDMAGKVKDFSFKGLDAELEYRKDKACTLTI